MRHTAGARVHPDPHDTGWRCLVLVSAALSLMLTLGGQLVAPDGCSVVAVWDDGSAVAACTDHHTWFVFEPHLTRHGLWSLTHEEPPGLPSFQDPAPEHESDVASAAPVDP